MMFGRGGFNEIMWSNPIVGLQDSEVGLSESMIWDDVLNTMEPASSHRRMGLMGTWGLVLGQIKKDARIRCWEGVNGVTGEVDMLFTWVYTPKKKGKSGRDWEEEEEGEGGGGGGEEGVRKGGRRKVLLG